MNIGNLGRAMAFSVLAGVLLATAVTLSREEDNPSTSDPFAPTVDPHQTELARCKALHLEAVNDTHCHAAWAQSFARFFKLRRVPEHGPGDLPPAAPGTRGAP